MSSSATTIRVDGIAARSLGRRRPAPPGVSGITSAPVYDARMATWETVVQVDPEILGGTPVFRGTRVPVKNLLDQQNLGALPIAVVVLVAPTNRIEALRPLIPRLLQTVVHEAEEGGYWAEVPAIPGCATQGETFEELLQNLYEAVEGCLSVDVDTPKTSPRQKVFKIVV